MNKTSAKTAKEIEILTMRAKQYAKPRAEMIKEAPSTLLVFTMEKEHKYSVEFNEIERVIPSQEVQIIPDINPIFAGLIYYNAEFWPVIELNVLFGHNRIKAEHLILLQDDSFHYALSIGAVVEQIPYNPAYLDNLLLKDNKNNPYIAGIYQSEIAVIDIPTILNAIRTTEVGIRR